MRSGFSTILQTLTPEAATVLNHSTAEAGRRNHNQTTPLHVAATLLAAPTGFLRQACIRSHPNSSHPLQCRALELCFSVALERLPSATSSPAVTEPPLSNALMAALKRAQAHQRRGFPDQQPMLPVKVELQQLIISVLDDPSVSRVMREASFSSPAVKATIENNISGGFRASTSHNNSRFHTNDQNLLFTSNSYLNPILRTEDVTRGIETMSKSTKKNPMIYQLNAPSSPVRTDLVLGPKAVHDHQELPVKDYLGCLSSEPRAASTGGDTSDSFKKLLKALMKMAWWQPEAASTIASTVTQCVRGSLWLLFAGPDRVGKTKMASVLAQHVCGADPITICLGSRRDVDEAHCGFRGKTMLDRIFDAVRRNPFSVIVLLDVDEADMVVRRGVKEAMERGRVADSHGREVSLGNVIFVLTGNWSNNNGDEMEWLRSSSTGDWELKLRVCENRPKRRADWLSEIDYKSRKQRKKIGSGLSLDLNLAVVDAEEERTDTSDLTIEQGEEHPHSKSASVLVPHELAGLSVAVVFKPVQFGLIRLEIKKTLKNTFSAIFDEKLSVELDDATLDNIVSGLWFGRTSLEDWTEQVLAPSIYSLVGQLPCSVEHLMVRLESDQDLDQANRRPDRLPSKINVIVDTVFRS